MNRKQNVVNRQSKSPPVHERRICSDTQPIVDQNSDLNETEPDLDRLRALYVKATLEDARLLFLQKLRNKITAATMSDADITKQLAMLGKCFVWTYDSDQRDITWLSKNFPRERAFTPHIFEWVISELEMNIRRFEDPKSDDVILKLSKDEEIIQTCPNMRRLEIFVESVKQYWAEKRKILAMNSRLQKLNNQDAASNARKDGAFIVVFRPENIKDDGQRCGPVPSNAISGLLTRMATDAEAKAFAMLSSGMDKDPDGVGKGSSALTLQSILVKGGADADVTNGRGGIETNRQTEVAQCGDMAEVLTQGGLAQHQAVRRLAQTDGHKTSNDPNSQLLITEDVRRQYKGIVKKLVDRFGRDVVMSYVDKYTRERAIRMSLQERSQDKPNVAESSNETEKGRQEDLTCEESNDETETESDNEIEQAPHKHFHPTTVIMADGRAVYRGIVRETIDESGSSITERYTGAEGQVIGAPIWIRSYQCSQNRSSCNESGNNTSSNSTSN